MELTSARGKKKYGYVPRDHYILLVYASPPQALVDLERLTSSSLIFDRIRQELDMLVPI